MESKIVEKARPRKWCFGKQQEGRSQHLAVEKSLGKRKEAESEGGYESSWPCFSNRGLWEIRYVGHFVY